MNNAESDRGVLGRAFTLLDALVSHSDGVGLSWIAHSCGVPKTTAYRLLRQLEALGAVQRCDGLYRVGSNLFRLGQAWEPYPRLLSAARRPLDVLAAATKASAVLTVRSHGGVMIAAASPVRVEDALLLRPGCAVPEGVELVMAPVLAPTGRNVGMVGTVSRDHPQPGFVSEIARAVSAALR
ncbi:MULTISPECIES: helix-turn-helix domain-containing protein [Actinokineospora]|uniref:HTH iclR-type domain-containing protein n=1 Tax=Actinokineospora fastidiosa TaxID=1816 RepID=A0A918LCP3_9PSEU|nr:MULTISPECIES: helix-turn-helix domain-containing protein [Actinokineospora]UVS79615.1 DNA-binding transcriptional activator MhpR [Actinokineospora sp. UTMC 2448]GGS29904.1 hypothetical protein GCM10010171_24100 [Actinokineospora fastidiosa]